MLVHSSLVIMKSRSFVLKFIIILLEILKSLSPVTCIASIKHHDRAERGLIFTTGSAFGYLVAIAVPINTVSRNVFLSFNFESNFALPNNDTHDFIDKWNIDDQSELFGNKVTSVGRRQHLRSIFSRKNFYKTIEGHLQNFKLNGTDCLLLLICEISERSVSESNGFIGNLLDTILRPSTSQQEYDIHLKYYEAEHAGLKKQDCSSYHQNCSISILDLISSMHNF